MTGSQPEPELAAWWRAVAAEREADAAYGRALRRSKLAKSMGTPAFKRSVIVEVQAAVAELTQARQRRVALEAEAAHVFGPPERPVMVRAR